MLKKIIIKYLFNLTRKIFFFFLFSFSTYLSAQEKSMNSVFLDIPFIDIPNGSNK